MEVLDTSDLIDRLRRRNVSPEELINRSIYNLYSIENNFRVPSKIRSRNSVRATIAYVKLLYDFGQQMQLSRTYLLHRIKLLEVRKNDLNLEISVLRGVTPPSIGEGHSFFGSANNNESRDQSGDQERHAGLNIVLDTEVIQTIDHSRSCLARY